MQQHVLRVGEAWCLRSTADVSDGLEVCEENTYGEYDDVAGVHSRDHEHH